MEKADAAFHAGYAALSNNDLAEARVEFQKVVKLVPQIEEGHSALGAVLLHLSAYPEAMAELKTALRLEPGMKLRKPTWPWPTRRAATTSKRSKSFINSSGLMANENYFRLMCLSPMRDPWQQYNKPMRQ